MLTNIPEIAQDTYGKLLRFNILAGSNLIVFGEPGIGKTEMAIDISRQMGCIPLYVNLTTMEAPDLVGIPRVEHGRSVYAPPQFLPLEGLDDPNDKEGKPARYVLIVDEIDKVKSELQNPMLEIFQSFTLNGKKIKLQAVIATGNTPEDNSFSLPVSHALTNRCMVYKMKLAFEPWFDWAVKKRINPLVIGFLEKHQDFISMKAVDNDPTAYNRPSPRSWSKAAVDLDKLNEFSDKIGVSDKEFIDYQTMIVASRVGSNAAVKFRVWLEHYRKIEPFVKRLMETGEPPEFHSYEIDKQMVTAISSVMEITKLMNNKEKKEKVHTATSNVFSWLGTIPVDFQIAAVKTNLRKEDMIKYDLQLIPNFLNLFKKVSAVYNMTQ